MRTLFLLAVSVVASGCRMADTPNTPSTSVDAAAISGYDAQERRATSEAAYLAGRR